MAMQHKFNLHTDPVALFRAHQPKRVVYECPRCDSVFFDRPSLADHVVSHLQTEEIKAYQRFQVIRKMLLEAEGADA